MALTRLADTMEKEGESSTDSKRGCISTMKAKQVLNWFRYMTETSNDCPTQSSAKEDEHFYNTDLPLPPTGQQRPLEVKA